MSQNLEFLVSLMIRFSLFDKSYALERKRLKFIWKLGKKKNIREYFCPKKYVVWKSFVIKIMLNFILCLSFAIIASKIITIYSRFSGTDFNISLLYRFHCCVLKKHLKTYIYHYKKNTWNFSNWWFRYWYLL